MANAEEAKRQKFVIEIAPEDHFPFEAIAETKFITSNQLCKLVSELFHNVFADFEGCLFNVSNNEPTISLIFNHGEYAEGATRACERLSAKTVGSTVIDRGRSRDSLIKDGDRYYLTEDGQDVVKDLLIRRLYNNGNPNLRNVVSEFTDRGPINSYFQQIQPQYTMVSYISIDRLCGLLFGDKDEEGNPVEYSVNIATAINPPYAVNPGISVNTNYVLNISQISSKELSKLCDTLGLTSSGINIIR